MVETLPTGVVVAALAQELDPNGLADVFLTDSLRFSNVDIIEHVWPRVSFVALNLAPLRLGLLFFLRCLIDLWRFFASYLGDLLSMSVVLLNVLSDVKIYMKITILSLAVLN